MDLSRGRFGFVREKPLETVPPIPEKTTVVECDQCSQRLTFVGRIELYGMLNWCSCGGTFNVIYQWEPHDDEPDAA